MAVSDIDATFETEAFKSWKKAQDHKARVNDALFKRLDNLSKQLVALAKAR